MDVRRPLKPRLKLPRTAAISTALPPTSGHRVARPSVTRQNAPLGEKRPAASDCASSFVEWAGSHETASAPWPASQSPHGPAGGAHRGVRRRREKFITKKKSPGRGGSARERERERESLAHPEHAAAATSDRPPPALAASGDPRIWVAPEAARTAVCSGVPLASAERAACPSSNARIGPPRCRRWTTTRSNILSAEVKVWVAKAPYVREDDRRRPAPPVDEWRLSAARSSIRKRASYHAKRGGGNASEDEQRVPHFGSRPRHCRGDMESPRAVHADHGDGQRRAPSCARGAPAQEPTKRTRLISRSSSSSILWARRRSKRAFSRSAFAVAAIVLERAATRERARVKRGARRDEARARQHDSDAADFFRAVAARVSLSRARGGVATCISHGDREEGPGRYVRTSRPPCRRGLRSARARVLVRRRSSAAGSCYIHRGRLVARAPPRAAEECTRPGSRRRRRVRHDADRGSSAVARWCGHALLCRCARVASPQARVREAHRRSFSARAEASVVRPRSQAAGWIDGDKDGESPGAASVAPSSRFVPFIQHRTHTSCRHFRARCRRPSGRRFAAHHRLPALRKTRPQAQTEGTRPRDRPWPKKKRPRDGQEVQAHRFSHKQMEPQIQRRLRKRWRRNR